MMATGFVFVLIFIIMIGSIGYTMVEIRNEMRRMNEILANHRNGGGNGV